MDIRYSNHPNDSKKYNTIELRKNYLQEKIFSRDEICLTYSHVDRIIFGGAMPGEEKLILSVADELRAEYFLQRREMGVINVGSKGIVVLDGIKYELDKYEGLYIGRGTKEIIFISMDKSNPAKFYINSVPAHTSYPIVRIDRNNAVMADLGERKNMNERTIYKFIHPNVCKSCQLSMGVTMLKEGSGWNSMPCHTHERRMEVYFYFDLPEEQRIFHLMGQQNETRHIVVANEQAVISPSWSIHAGVGTSNYTFIWGMCGENQDFDDMDHIAIKDLK
ncbi:5-dehydro-4-deoxy-D-glucuronate isomerase [Clostridiaceae bacterium UIB06]|uniref:4-deoxy-L-threo-5-hexosulose-uronate ketol-isomerase n=1 Tax=Clostridium thailandense TaxID=2794346 RepID=A0A949X4Q1_9CLOT|nr:5-dehydro-4-deoxy-D-glucuronate isomerase [Clostridium thailandense]MBV7276919.1 5-dehydro-4-deoxy-D-glucuronate isomerase [Clostridium thailandense]MCH5138378.1 5-dehydro-4-deoxy-D-glucuronate isomerase [Clostridiaceae bacterium UIB06]